MPTKKKSKCPPGQYDTLIELSFMYGSVCVINEGYIKEHHDHLDAPGAVFVDTVEQLDWLIKELVKIRKQLDV